ncbi:hypothetical protein pb186bvf_006256 [Paramecium bursaria]
MGNLYLCQDTLINNHNKPQSQTKLIKHHLMEISKKALIQIQKVPRSTISEQFINFHRHTLGQTIHDFRYFQQFQNYNQDDFSCVQEIVPNETEVSNLIREDIRRKKDKSIVYSILVEYQNFYLLVWDAEKQKSQSFTPEMMTSQSRATSFNESPSHFNQNWRSFHQAIKQDSSNSIIILYSMVALFGLLKFCVYRQYEDLLAVIPNTFDNLITREMIVQRSIQSYIYDQGFIPGKLLIYAIQQYYTQNTTTLCMPYPDFGILQSGLMPVDNVMQQAAESRSIFFESQKLYNDEMDQVRMRSSSQLQEINFQFRVNKAIEQISIQNLPYKQVFPYIQKMTTENRAYKIYRLIREIDNKIVQLYMSQRPAELVEKYQQIICTEDNRVDILLFVLHKFREATGCDMKKYLLCKIKFISDFDQVLDNTIKNVVDQSFSRFWNCVEMIVETP